MHSKELIKGTGADWPGWEGGNSHRGPAELGAPPHEKGKKKRKKGRRKEKGEGKRKRKKEKETE